MSTEMIELIVKVVVVLIAFVLTNVAVPWLKAKVGEEKLTLIYSYASAFVNGVEQKITESGKGEEKLAEVTTLLSNKAKQIGLSLSADDIRLIIESAVKEMKELS